MTSTRTGLPRTGAATALTFVGALGSLVPFATASPQTIVDEAFEVLESTVTPLSVHDERAVPIVTPVLLDGNWCTLELQPATVRHRRYELLVEQEDGSLRRVEPGVEGVYRGTIAEDPGAIVAATLMDDGLHARIVCSTGEFWVQPAAARVDDLPPDEYVIYRSESVIASDGLCATAEFAGEPKQAESENDPPIAYSGQLCVAELACDADSLFLDNWGSVSAVEDRINSVVNAVNVQYEQDVGITHQITTIIVRSSGSDPYSTTVPGDLLAQFRSHWLNNHGGISRDVAHLFTGRNLDGTTVGVAYVGTICTNGAYGLSQSDCCGTLACASDLTAHELGHNWNSGHCTCSGYTMNPSLTCSNMFNASSVSVIGSHRDSRTCLDCGVAPPASCGDADAGDCMTAHAGPACDDADCCSTVCAIDPMCCDTAWDEICADQAAAMCGGDPGGGSGPGEPTTGPVSNFQVKKGTYLSGELRSLFASDNERLRIRGALSSGQYRTQARVTAISPVTTISQLNVTAEVGVNVTGVRTVISLRNFALGGWDRLESYVQPDTDLQRLYINIPSPNDYVSGTGRVKVRILTRKKSGSYVARIDQVEVVVVP
ncbi:MAG: M12 family metallo-peptidase [Planctomycetota bacterium]|jgi:hypothetical protein